MCGAPEAQILGVLEVSRASASQDSNQPEKMFTDRETKPSGSPRHSASLCINCSSLPTNPVSFLSWKPVLQGVSTCHGVRPGAKGSDGELGNKGQPPALVALTVWLCGRTIRPDRRAWARALRRTVPQPGASRARGAGRAGDLEMLLRRRKDKLRAEQ